MASHLITGGAGFLGQLLAHRLHEIGERVRIFDILPRPAALPAGMEFVQGDILDAHSLKRALNGVEVVHHSAALVPVTKAGRRFWQVNVEGTRNTLECSVREGVRFFIYLSSSAVFGIPQRCPITQETPLAPVEDYGRSKLEGEKLVRLAAGEGLPAVIVRPRTIVGPGRLGIFKVLFEWIREGRRIFVLGDGNNRFQFVHGRDVADCILLLVEKRIQGAFNVGAAEYGTLRHDLAGLIRHAGTASRVVGTPRALAVASLRALDILGMSPLARYHYLVYPQPFYFDIDLLREKAGFSPKYGNIETLTSAYDWYLEHPSPPAEADGGYTHMKPVKEGILKILKRLS